jgi:hypothetical protein
VTAVHERVFYKDFVWYVMSPDGEKQWYQLKLQNSKLSPKDWDWLQNNEPQEKPTIIAERNIEEWRKIWNR